MNTEPTTEMMNEAICEFMGGHRMISGTIHVYKGPDEIEWETGKYLKYHTSWDWLMPVVLKAKALYLNFESDEIRNQLKMRYKAIQNELCNLSIKNVHYCLFKFITWYKDNQQKQTNE